MKYPMLNNWLKTHENDDGTYTLTDINSGKTYKMRRELYHYLSKLDGKTHPYEINKSFSEDFVDRLMDQCKDEGLIRRYRLIIDFPQIIFTLWIPKITKSLIGFAKLYNALLRLLWWVAPAIGIYMFINNFYLSTDYMIPGYIAGTVAGMLIHELSHMLTGLAYSADVYELGLMLNFFMPGAYVMLDCDDIKNRFQKMQIYAAGIKSNIMLAGIFLILSTLWYETNGFMLGAALTNLFLGIFNASLIGQLDGMMIFNEIMGTDNFISLAGDIIKNKRKRQALIAQGVQGKAKFAACCIICSTKIVMPLIFAANIIGVIECLV